MEVTFLFAEYLLPVCHAALLTDDDLPGLLNRLTRIHRRQNPDAWLHYARECGLALDNPAQGPRYDLHEMAIAAVPKSAGSGPGAEDVCGKRAERRNAGLPRGRAPRRWLSASA